MTAKHRDPEYRANAAIVRAKVRRARKLGNAVTCWRCGYDIDPEQAYDVGHINANGGHSLDNLAPEHRYKTSRCRGNRSAGGQLGALRTNQRRGPVPPPAPSRPAPGLLPW